MNPAPACCGPSSHLDRCCLSETSTRGTAAGQRSGPHTGSAQCGWASQTSLAACGRQEGPQRQRGRGGERARREERMGERQRERRRGRGEGRERVSERNNEVYSPSKINNENVIGSSAKTQNFPHLWSSVFMFCRGDRKRRERGEGRG